ncbi:uncharacterized protein LOC144883201 [Branchiostoma floridae x Branchiostoma japonicum]
MTPFLLLFVALATASPVRNHHELDANGDGQISRQEALQAFHLDQVLHALDSDHDRAFTEQEALQFLDHHFFAQLDTDHDHTLTFDEIRGGLTLGSLFDFYDHNHDGFLTGSEDDKWFTMWNAVHGHGGGNFRNHHELDANGDGLVTLPEVTNSINIDTAIAALDSDGDMMFTEAQALQFMSHNIFAHVDTNHDHSLSFDEIRAGLTLGDLFNFYDRDGDGFLTGTEQDQFQAIWNSVHGHGGGNKKRQAAAIDADGDGLISLTEVHAVMTLQNALAALDADGDHGFTEQETTDFFGDATLYAQWNTNGDDHLSFGEVHHGITLDGMFAWFDTNGDGFLEGPEADKVVYVYDLMVAAGIHHGNFRNVRVMDTNGDGHLAKTEVLNALTLDEVLVAMDANGDQQFTVDDAMQFIDHHYFNTLDRNHDHVITFDEIRAGTSLGELFDFYDENGDGFLYGTEADLMIYMYNEVQNNANASA